MPHLTATDGVVGAAKALHRRVDRGRALAWSLLQTGHDFGQRRCLQRGPRRQRIKRGSHLQRGMQTVFVQTQTRPRPGKPDAIAPLQGLQCLLRLQRCVIE